MCIRDSPTTGELLLTDVNTTEFNQYEIETTAARFVKLQGFGRFNTAADTRVSVWSAVREIEFYGSSIVSVEEPDIPNQVSISPIPATNLLHLDNTNGIDLITIYSLDGKKMMELKINGSTSEVDLDVSAMKNGSYVLVFQGNNIFESEKIVIIR